MYEQEKAEKIRGMQNAGQLGGCYSQPQMANSIRPSTEVEQHLHRCNERLEHLNMNVNQLREVLANVLAENGPECPATNAKEPPVQVTCMMSDRLATLTRQVESIAYEIQNITNRVRA